MSIKASTISCSAAGRYIINVIIIFQNSLARPHGARAETSAHEHSPSIRMLVAISCRRIGTHSPSALHIPASAAWRAWARRS